MQFLKVVCLDKLVVGTKKPSKCLFTLTGLQVTPGGYYNKYESFYEDWCLFESQIDNQMFGYMSILGYPSVC